MTSELMARAPPPHGILIDGVSIFWITFSSVWTAILIAGMVFLYTRRKMPILRIRGLPLSFGAVILMHIYWLAVQWGYTYGHMMPAYVEFWIMSIWFPFGIALFHASNSRFLYVAQAQKRYIRTSGETLDQIGRRKTLMGRYRAMDYTNRMLLLVGIGMIFQVCIRTLSCNINPILTGSVLRHHLHVPHLEEVSPILRSPWNRDDRQRDGTEGPRWTRLGMVAFHLLAGLLGLDCRAHHPVAFSQPP